MEIVKENAKTVVTSPVWGRFQIWTLYRGWLRRSRTIIEHTGQFDLEVLGFDDTAGAGHAKAVRRLREHMRTWEDDGTFYPLKPAADGIDMTAIRQYEQCVERRTWVCPDPLCTYGEKGLVDHPLGSGVCRHHPGRRLVRFVRSQIST